MTEKQLRHRRWLAQGICPECGTNPLHHNRKRCAPCLQKSQVREKFKFSLKAATARKTGKSCYVQGYSPTWIQEVISKFNGRCAYTGWPIAIGENAAVDHNIPRSRIGSGWTSEQVLHPNNLVWCHQAVNTMKGNQTGPEFTLWMQQHLPQAVAFVQEGTNG